MKNLVTKGENLLIQWSAVDRSRAEIPWASISALEVVITDQNNLSYTFSKAGGTITEDTGTLSLELTSIMTQALAAGSLTARFTYTVTDARFASGSYIDIIDEGTTSVFINLQE